MNRLAKNFITTVLLGSALLVVGLSSASSNGLYHTEKQIIINLSDENENSSKKDEFWEKFRQSVQPREEPPPAAHSPRETHPREVKPREVQPREVNPK